MKATLQERKIAEMIQPAIADLGFDLVQVRLIGSQKLQTLQIMAEDPKTGKLDLNGCTAISRSVSAILDVEDPIASAYQLEVSSPGIDRPLVKPADFAKYVGFDITLEIDSALDNGQKRFRGKITAANDETVTIANEIGAEDTGSVTVDYAGITKAKLVLTDALLPPVGEKKGGAKKEKKEVRPLDEQN